MEPVIDPQSEPKSRKEKQKVRIFFDKLERSSLMKYIQFDSSVEKAQAIIRFAKMIGIPPSHLPMVITKFRQLSKQK